VPEIWLVQLPAPLHSLHSPVQLFVPWVSWVWAALLMQDVSVVPSHVWHVGQFPSPVVCQSQVPVPVLHCPVLHPVVGHWLNRSSVFWLVQLPVVHFLHVWLQLLVPMVSWVLSGLLVQAPAEQVLQDPHSMLVWVEHPVLSVQVEVVR